MQGDGLKEDNTAALPRVGLRWHAVGKGGAGNDDGSGGESVVFIERRWLRARLASKPKAARVAAEGKKTADLLLAYHEAMLGLEAEVRERRAVLCLLQDEKEESDGVDSGDCGKQEAVEEMEAVERVALDAHGLCVAAVVAGGEERAWAAARGATAMAVLREVRCSVAWRTLKAAAC